MSRLSQRVERLEGTAAGEHRSYEELVEYFTNAMTEQQKQDVIDNPSEYISRKSGR